MGKLVDSHQKYEIDNGENQNLYPSTNDSYMNQSNELTTSSLEEYFDVIELDRRFLNH